MRHFVLSQLYGSHGVLGNQKGPLIPISDPARITLPEMAHVKEAESV
jgi:hypothetical protein